MQIWRSDSLPCRECVCIAQTIVLHIIFMIEVVGGDFKHVYAILFLSLWN
jgi:hypothetical protein